MSLALLGTAYQLLDSGEGAKLERIGDKTLIRPSSSCVWKRNSRAAWDRYDARYDDRTWEFRGAHFEGWTVTFPACVFQVRLQKNGQIGLFPEHSAYLPKVSEFVRSLARHPLPRALNLFAFSGLASVILARAGAHVTHVDISKTALAWAEENFSLNSIAHEQKRFILEDALLFMQRELKRAQLYQVILADPPSFSRIDKHTNWDLEDVFVDLLVASMKLLDPTHGMLLFSTHHPALNALVAENVVRDIMRESPHPLRKFSLSRVELTLPEQGSGRAIPSGSALCLRLE